MLIRWRATLMRSSFYSPIAANTTSCWRALAFFSVAADCAESIAADVIDAFDSCCESVHACRALISFMLLPPENHS